MNVDPARGTETVVVLLAAGEGRRFGALKQLTPIDGEPMVSRVTRVLVCLQLPVLVVTGAAAEEVAAALTGLPVACISNPAWRDGLGASLGTGVRAVREHFPRAAAALVCLADHPLLDVGALEAMLERHAREPERIFAADHAGMPGPPVLFPADCFPELAAWQGAEGAQAWLRRQGTRVERVSLDVTDVDTLADLERVQRQLVQLNAPSRAS